MNRLFYFLLLSIIMSCRSKNPKSDSITNEDRIGQLLKEMDRSEFPPEMLEPLGLTKSDTLANFQLEAHYAIFKVSVDRTSQSVKASELISDSTDFYIYSNKKNKTIKISMAGKNIKQISKYINTLPPVSSCGGLGISTTPDINYMAFQKWLEKTGGGTTYRNIRIVMIENKSYYEIAKNQWTNFSKKEIVGFLPPDGITAGIQIINDNELFAMAKFP